MSSTRGSLLYAVEMRGTPVDRFWAKVDQQGDKDCWPWLGAKNRNGYGRFHAPNERTHRSTWQAHRFAYTVGVGPIPPTLVVRHRCDNPSCVNPTHLDVGTQADNVKDRDKRGRHPGPVNKKYDSCLQCGGPHRARGMCESCYNRWYHANRRRA